MFSTLNEKNGKSSFCFFNDGKKHKVRELDKITRKLRSGVSFFSAAEWNAWYSYLTICLLLVQNLVFSLIGQETKGT